jgi:predicted DNA-binding protein (UPF0278 family)
MLDYYIACTNTLVSLIEYMYKTAYTKGYRLNLEHVTSPLRNKYRTTFKSLIIDSKEDEE